jgi:predicted DNA-binding protein YlxM (UPF0122 family)
VSAFIFISCGKKDEDTSFAPPNEISSDKERELKEKEEFLRLKEEELRNQNQQQTQTPDTTVNNNNNNELARQDSILKQRVKDSIKTVSQNIPQKKEKKELVKKEKDLNKRLDNPKAAIDDYLEYIKRGVGEEGNFDKNMGAASELWTGRSKNTFKSAYKNTKEFIVVSEPEVVSQKGDNATVKVRIKQVEKVNGKDKSSEMTVTYNLVADSKGKWKIKGNKVKRK